jgi:signal transduction histidine kinase
VDDDTRETVQVLANSTQNLSALVDAILRLSKFDEGAYILEQKPHSIKQIVEQAINANRAEMEQRQKKLTVNYEVDETVQVDADESLLSEAVSNIIINAVKYGDKTVEITVKNTPVHESSVPMCEIVVRNDGASISGDDIEHIFERFYKVDKSRNRNDASYGIGLSIVNRIVSAHNGAIFCKNEPDNKVSFHLLLPLFNETTKEK